MTCPTLPVDAFGHAPGPRRADGATPCSPGAQPALRRPAGHGVAGVLRDAALALAALGAVLATGPARAAVSLQVTLEAPTQLHLGVADRYTVTASNTGSTSAGSPVMRLPLATGQLAMLPLPPGCAEVTEPIPPGQNAVRQIRCTTSTVPARGKRSWSFVLQAPAAPATVSHRAHVSATGSPALWSNTVSTAYASYSVPITPGTAWVISSCYNGSAGPVAWNLCPASAEVSGEIVFAVGGVVDSAEGPIGTWLQTDPLSLRIDSAPGYGADPMVLQYTVVNSRCLRGGGVTTPPPGGTVIYSASKVCRL